jgi:pimeloyl-ACP methyl ester carboxylesterase
MAWPEPFTKQRVVRVGEVETYVAEVGDGAPVVFLHGNPDTHAVWATTVGAMTGVRCIAPDLPGFGRSTPPLLDLSLESQARWVRGLLAALDLDRVHLVVHDIGGVYGLAFATLHPQRLLSLTVLDTIFFADYHWHFFGRVWRTRWLGEAAMALSMKWLFVSQLRRGSPALPSEYADLAFAEFTPATKRHVLDYYRASSPSIWEGWEDRMRAAIANVPTLVLWGDADPFIGKKFADRFGVAPVHCPHGHWLMVEDPEWCAAKISERVKTLAGM